MDDLPVKPWQVPLGGLGRPMQERVADWANGLIAAAVAQERERCAQVVSDFPNWIGHVAKAEIVAAIRATIPRTDQEQA